MTVSGYGVDVVAYRVDDLDRRVLAAVADCRHDGYTPTVLDAGCGSGGLCKRLGRLGAEVSALDIVDYERAFADLALPNVQFIEADVADYIHTSESVFDMVVLQRVLHYLPYQTAKTLLQTLATRTELLLFMAVTGLDSDIGQAYGATSLPITERWAPIDAAAQADFSLTAPVCLYSMPELASLVRECGWEVVDSWTSAFGNHKIVATPQTS